MPFPVCGLPCEIVQMTWIHLKSHDLPPQQQAHQVNVPAPNSNTHFNAYSLPYN